MIVCLKYRLRIAGVGLTQEFYSGDIEADSVNEATEKLSREIKDFEGGRVFKVNGKDYMVPNMSTAPITVEAMNFYKLEYAN